MDHRRSSMPRTTIRQKPGDFMCGLAKWHPKWLQQYATTKMFMIVYGLLGTIQATSYMYFVVTLTTLEKRFKIPSQTTGIILSGNEISQIMLSLVLSYVGGQRNRPRWIAWGIVFCGLSCYILALPHFIYGGGEDVLRLTQEYLDNGHTTIVDNSTLQLVNTTTNVKQAQQLCGASNPTEECNSLLSIVPLVLIFLSQFVLGVGNTLYYSLGQTYLDDNSKKTNTPLMLALAMSLRMIGPVLGFLLGYVSLNMFIDPSQTPLIDNKDPRWLGAWWFGWMILGTLMVLFSGLIGLFPKQLPPKVKPLRNSHVPHALRHEELQRESEGLPLGSAFSSTTALDVMPPTTTELPTLKDFPKALMRLLRNKLLIFNITSAIFYILGASGYMTFLTKYMEVQFHKSAQSATIVVGPCSIIGMVIGLIGSGLVISKKKPAPSKVLMWNVIVGFIYISGQVSYMFLFCGTDSTSMLVDGKLNVSAQCNANCACDNVPYAPLCHVPSRATYFSPCHAGCYTWDAQNKLYSNCTCLAPSNTWATTTSTGTPTESTTKLPAFLAGFNRDGRPQVTNNGKLNSLVTTPTPEKIESSTVFSTSSTKSSATSSAMPNTAETTNATPSITTTNSSSPSSTTTEATSSTTISTTTTTATATPTIPVPAETPYFSSSADDSTTTSTIATSTAAATVHAQHSDSWTLVPTTPTLNNDSIHEIRERKRRSSDDIPTSTTIPPPNASTQPSFLDTLTPGVCLEGCNAAFWTFSIASMVINWFGSSGRIGNILVNYRAVSAQDKSFAQGLSLMLLSLFALIPGPILFGRIIDSTCLVWAKTCNGRAGNCQLYDQATFRYLVNITAISLTVFGIFFDILVWYHGRHLDLYGDKDAQQLEEVRRRNKPLTPLLAKK